MYRKFMEESKIYRTDFLFASPSFLNGFASIRNIHGILNYNFNYSETSEKANAKAIENDWGVVMQDLNLAFEDISSDVK